MRIALKSAIDSFVTADLAYAHFFCAVFSKIGLLSLGATESVEGLRAAGVPVTHKRGVRKTPRTLWNKLSYACCMMHRP